MLQVGPSQVVTLVALGEATQDRGMRIVRSGWAGRYTPRAGSSTVPLSLVKLRATLQAAKGAGQRAGACMTLAGVASLLQAFVLAGGRPLALPPGASSCQPLP